MTFYVATYDELNHGFAQEVARIGALFGAAGYLQLGRGVHTVNRTDIECIKTDLALWLADQSDAFAIVAVETSGEPLTKFGHPENAIYVFGPRIGTLPESALTAADDVVRIEGPVIPTDVAAGIVLHHRRTA